MLQGQRVFAGWDSRFLCRRFATARNDKSCFGARRVVLGIEACNSATQNRHGSLWQSEGSLC